MGLLPDDGSSDAGAAGSSGATTGSGTSGSSPGFASGASPGSGSGGASGTAGGSGAGATGRSSGGASGSNGSTSPDGGGDAGYAGLDANVDASMTAPPSCAPGGPGMTNCGPGGSGVESCCTSLPVTAGTFYRTFSNDGAGPTGEADPATVSTFRLDKYLVTVGRFRQFVNALNHGWTPPAGSGKHVHVNGGRGLVDVGAPGSYETGWRTSDNWAIATTDLVCQADATWTAAPDTRENLPINCVNWVEAQAFCIWDQAFLPTEAEWEYAAAGGAQQREYPWGSTDPGTASKYAIYGCYFPNGDRHCTGVVDYAPVGTPLMGAGLWHQLDIEGEVEEWVLDWFSQTYVDPCIDCGLLTAPPGSSRVYRGGPLNAAANYLLTWARESWDPYAVIDGPGDIGIRCARTP